MGDGPYRDACLAMAMRADLASSLNFLESDASVTTLLNRSDILILPSANEGLALVCFEAVRQGVIPVSTDVGAQRELLPQSLLTHPEPFRCVRQTVNIVRRLVTDQSFLKEAALELAKNYTNIASEPNAEDVFMKIYQSI